MIANTAITLADGATVQKGDTVDLKKLKAAGADVEWLKKAGALVDEADYAKASASAVKTIGELEFAVVELENKIVAKDAEIAELKATIAAATKA